ncbi:MAG: amidohydrolase [Clostridiales Family XIII bacterium]|jgi:predicted amidohydrolase YtcJ|nr:amidohydrolase [Clostridiales Family XIII bacterium]
MDFRFDKLFFGGKIYTMNAPGETVEAIVAHDGKIVFAGSDEEAARYPVREKEDLGGRVGMPGISDTHIHLLMDCNNRAYVQLNKARSIDEIVEIMRAHDDGASDLFTGCDVTMSDLAENRYPHRYELDRISVSRPVCILSHCLHVTMANSKALELAGLTKESAAGDACVSFCEDGEPDGIVREEAYAKYFAPILATLFADEGYRKGILKKYLADYSRHGYTTLHAISSYAAAPPLEYFGQYCDLEREGTLPVRVIINSAHFPDTLNTRTGFGTDMVKTGAKKIYLDGSLGGRTAAMREPYSDAPGEKGDLFYTKESLVAAFRDAYDNGLEASVHVIGDAAMDLAIAAAEEVYPASDERRPEKRLAAAGTRRLRIIHASIADPSQIDRLRRLPVILDVQPNFIHSDGGFAPDRLGPGRMKFFTPLRSYIDAGLLLAGGSDAPVDPPLPFLGMECAVTRKSIDGFPAEGLLPEEALSVYEAVSLYTRNAAYCSGEENVKGTISAGKYADFILLDKDIFEIEPTKIHTVGVLKTVVGGRTRWERRSEQ